MSISTAVSLARVSNIVGYMLATGNFAASSPNLPQRIALLGEANTANQSGLSTAPKEITSAQQAGQIYGFGSPIHMAARILLPASGGGVSGVPVIVYPQAAASGGAARVQTITVTGTAAAGGTHYVRVAGRNILDGTSYAVNIAAGDTNTVIAGKIRDAINGVLGSPLSATAAAAVATTTTRWAGLTAQGVSILMDTTDGTAVGVTYAVAETTAGSGTPDIGPALAQFGSDWNTIVVNPYGTVSAVMTALETANGIPDPVTPTGRYAGIIMKPFIAITGSVADDPTSVTDARPSQVTIAIAPAPLSGGLALEAAANMAVLFATVSQDSPHLDVCGLSYPDMPAPTSTPAMASYDVRDSYVKKGCSTVDLISGVYKVCDFVTTYHPNGEVPPQFRYCRNLMLDFNVRFTYYLLEQENVVNHVIANDADDVSATNVIKPKQWRQILAGMFTDLARRGLIASPGFSTAGLLVGISSTNPDRLETRFPYKRTGIARIASTTVQAGFNFGSA